MRYSFLKTLHCPYSGSDLDLTAVIGEGADEVRNGIVRTDAGDFPIIDGILRLHVDEYREVLVNLVRGRKTEDALLVALDVPSHSRWAAGMDFASRLAYRAGANRFAQCFALGKRGIARVLIDPSRSFEESVKGISSGPWSAWQLYRFTMPTFLPVFPLLHVVSTGPVLEFGCGVGHAAFLLSRMGEGCRLTCTDYSFSTLYIARKYFAPSANFVCLDGDYLLPFSDRYFSTILSSDTLHCVDSKLSLSREFTRVLASDGAIVLPHLHNGLSKTRFRQAMAPKAYGNLFRDWYRRVVPEESLIRDYVDEGMIDLQRDWTDVELNAADSGVSVVVSARQDVFRTYSDLWTARIARMENPAINPLYRQRRVNGHRWILERRPDHAYPQPLPRVDTKLLPAATEIKIEAADGTSLRTFDLLKLRQERPERFLGLAKQFVVIDLPQQYQ